VTKVLSVADEAPQGWDESVVAPPGGHVLQSRAWAEHRAGQGWRPHFVTFDDGRRALVLIRNQSPLPGWAGYAPRGPIHAGDGPAPTALRVIALADWAKTAGGRVLTADPELDASPEYDRLVESRGYREREEIQASRHRLLVPLPPGTSEDTLLAAMTKSARQRIRAAEAAGTVIEEDPAGDRLPDLARMLGEAGEAKNFSIGHVNPLLAWWRRVLAAGHARFWLATHDGATVGALLAYVQGGHLATAYSADDRSRRSELSGTMHLLRWNFLRTALTLGGPYADLGGVDVAGARRVPTKGEPTYGLYEHKHSLGAVWTESAAAHEVVLRPAWQGVAQLLSRVRRG
jgi:lipid II:glycine glycyltransferase (peptidoglycan interpeptide bridge formation enzyme)